MARVVTGQRLLTRNFGNCLSLPGASSQCSVPNAVSIHPGNFLSLNFWMRPSSVYFGSFSTFVYKNYKVKIAATNGKIYAAINTGTETGVTSTVLKKNEWQMITLTFDGTLGSNNIKLYINGVLNVQGTKTGTIVDTSANPWAFGNDSSSGLIGHMDECSVDITRAYTATEISDLYYKGVLPSGYGLYLKFDEASGNALDSSPNGHIGTLSSGATRSTAVPFIPRTAASKRKRLLTYDALFENKTTGAHPSGWSKRWRIAETAVTYTSEAFVPTGSYDQKSLKIATAAANNGPQFIIDENYEMGSDGTIQIDVYVDKINGGDGNDGKIGIMARVSEAGCYIAYIKPQANVLRVSKMSRALSETIIQASEAISPTLAINTWYTIKLLLSGTTLKAKIWVKGTTEPAGWNIDTTDATYTNGKKVGVYTHSGANAWNGWATNIFSSDVSTRTTAI